MGNCLTYCYNCCPNWIYTLCDVVKLCPADNDSLNEMEKGTLTTPQKDKPVTDQDEPTGPLEPPDQDEPTSQSNNPKTYKPITEQDDNEQPDDQPKTVDTDKVIDKPPADQLVMKAPLINYGSVPNERYALHAPSSRDHDNEDDFLVHNDSFSVYLCVLDGHDGRNAVEFVKKYLQSNHLVVSQSDSCKDIIEKCIKDADAEFFKSIEQFLAEKSSIQDRIPKEMKSYEAQMRFPNEVARLQELDVHISGGCTAVIAVITKKRLYVANVGDSRAVLVYQEHDQPALHVKQLSEDHGVENEAELKRLSDLELDPEQLIRAGRLGTQENTRSIGDYSIKGGYKDVDVICHATDEPGISTPHVTSVEINPSFKYLILMTDGVYKTLEAVGQHTRGNDTIAHMINDYITEHGINGAAFKILENICQTQYNLYQTSASENPRSDIAVANRKRDDMTLVIYQFT